MISAVTQDATEKRKPQHNVGLDPEFNAKLLTAIDRLGIKRRPSQVIAEITEEFFDIWLAGEEAKRRKLEELKPTDFPMPLNLQDARDPNKKLVVGAMPTIKVTPSEPVEHSQKIQSKVRKKG